MFGVNKMQITSVEWWMVDGGWWVSPLFFWRDLGSGGSGRYVQPCLQVGLG